jgi:hypothetical protein
MVAETRLRPGVRVQVRGKPMNVTLRGGAGRIARADEYEGYYVVTLDTPALYHDGDITEELPEIVESADNLDVLDADQSERG